MLPRSGVHTQQLHSSMNRMKAVQPNTRKESVPPPAPPPSNLANYTLPGVIGYLTSEFTNLERYKIVTSLEKLEMGSRIQQLTAELNAMKFLNDKQALRIRELEARLASTDQPNAATTKGNNPTGSAAHGASPDSAAAKSASKPAGANDARETITDIPAVDLGVLRRSRQDLHRLIHEVMELLRPPSAVARNFVDVPAEDSGDFDDLLERAAAPRSGLFDRYTLGSDDLLDAARDASLLVGSVPLDLDLPDLGDLRNGSHHHSRRASDATVLADEAPAVAPRFGPHTALSAGRAFPPLRGSFAVAGDTTLLVFSAPGTAPPGSGPPLPTVSPPVAAASADAEAGFPDRLPRLQFSIPCDVDVLAAYPLAAKVLVVTAEALYVYAAGGSERIYDFDVLVARCAASAGGRGVRVAVAGSDASGPCVAVVDVATDWAQATSDAASVPDPNRPKLGAPRLAARFGAAALGQEPVSHLGWSAHNVVVAHGRLLVLRPDTHTCSTVFEGTVDFAVINGDYAILHRPRSVLLVHLVDGSVVATQHLEPSASYGLLVRGGAPYLVHLDQRVRILDRRFDEVASTAARGDALEWCAPDYLVVRAGLSISTIGVEWPE